MTLTHKIIVLLSFMTLVIFMILFWATRRIYSHLEHFKANYQSEQQKLMRERDKSIEKLNSKAQEVGENVSSHLSSMEATLKRRQKESEEFDKEFLEHQNGVFDAIENFHQGFERKEK